VEISKFYEKHRLDEDRGVRLREKSQSGFSSFFSMFDFFEKHWTYVLFRVYRSE
jgi:hypothetical protein